MRADIESILERYYEGETSIEEEKILKDFFRNEKVPAHLQSHAAQFAYFADTAKELPSLAFNSDLAIKLDPPQQGQVRRFGSWLLRIAAGLALLIVGFSGGWLFQSKSGAVASSEEKAPSADFINVLAFEKMGETSASERIQAVNQSYELSEASENITQTLVNTLNFDPNVNVRLAACQALLHFQNEPGVSDALIRSLTVQNDPNVQISLIEALVSIKEKRAADQFRQLMQNKEVLEAVRVRAESGLGQLTAVDV